MIMPSDECHGTLLMVSQHWLREPLAALRRQTITWASFMSPYDATKPQSVKQPVPPFTNVV